MQFAVLALGTNIMTGVTSPTSVHTTDPARTQIVLPGPTCITSVAVGAIPHAGSSGDAAAQLSANAARIQVWGKDARQPHAARFEPLSEPVQQPRKGTVQLQTKVPKGWLGRRHAAAAWLLPPLEYHPGCRPSKHP